MKHPEPIDLEQLVYGTPLSTFKPCPSCRRTDHVAIVLFGMPAHPPAAHEVDRVVFEGCVTSDGEVPDWWCKRCEINFSDSGKVLQVEAPD